MTSAPCGRLRGERAAFGLEQAGAHLLAGRQHGDDGVNRLPSSASEVADFAPHILGELRGALCVRVIGDDLIAAFHEIGRHRPAHIADADETDGFDIRHYSSPMS